METVRKNKKSNIYKEIQKMKKKLINLLIIIIIISTEIFLYNQMMFNKPELTIKYKLVFLFVCILANIIILIIHRQINKEKEIPTEKLFLLIASLIGGLYLIFIPAILGTDELPHFLRPYQISVGDIVVKHPEKNETLIPVDLANLTKNGLMSERYKKEMIFNSVDYNNTINLWNGDVTSRNYSPITYIPQITGFWLARILHLSPLLTMYCVRLLNFLSWLILSYFAIKLLPNKKIFAIIFYTSPAVLSLVSTCSGDTLTLGLLFLLISYILNLIKTQRIFTTKDYVILGLISIGISTYKLFYILELLFLFLIPIESFKGNKKKKIITLSSIIGISLILDLSWSFMTSLSSTIGSNLVSNQISFILHHPFKYIIIFVNTYINEIYYYITNFVAGSEMCYGLVRVNQLFTILYLATLLVSYFTDNEKIKINLSGKILIGTVILLLFGLVSTTLYLEWTAEKLGIGATVITGIQSRYFF